MSFDLFLRVGGYWSIEDVYVGGEPYSIGRIASEEFNLNSVVTVVVEHIGFEDNIKKISWFPPETPGKKEDIDDDAMLRKAICYGVGSGALTLFIVREDDPYLNRRGGELGFLSCHVNDLDNVEDNGGSGSAESYETDEVGEDIDDATDGEEINEEESPDLSCDSDDGREELDESKYRKFEVGQEYSTIQSFKSAINMYAVKKRRDIKYFKSDNKRVVAICSDRKCSWRISASINSTSCRVVIRALQDEHNCTWQGKVSLLTNARISDLFIEDFRLNLDQSANQLQSMLLKRNINVPWTICERTRLRCLRVFYDEQAESFARLFDYVAELKNTNPGSSVECEVRQRVFYRFYVCFHGLKDGWKASCRKILHVDGTFLKWRMTGQLLVACGRDPNDQMFPVAWAIVDAETKDNWIWFIEHLTEDLALSEGNGLTMVSDQCKGLVSAVSIVLPFAEHRLCARHVHDNWKKKYSGAEYEDLFWAAADSYYMAAFERKIHEMKMISQAAYDDLKVSINCPWSRAFFTEFSKCAAVENNLGESFNAAIRIARTKPVVEMLEEIRRRVMVNNNKKRSEAEKMKGIYTPRSTALLDQQISLTKDCSPLSCGLGKYEVGYFHDRFVVCLRGEIKCSCRMYMISGIPCCQIISALRFEKNLDQDPKYLISDWFTVAKLKRCYATGLEPVNGMNMWKITTEVRVRPPPYKKPPGRPPGKKRKRQKGEGREKGKMCKVGIKMHCSNCGQEGHYKNKCTNMFLPKPKKPSGRPRKTSSIERPSCQIDALSRSQFISLNEGPTDALSRSQFISLNEGPTSISSAFPRRRPGRPHKEAGTSSQITYSQIPNYDTGPIHLPSEGYGLFTSPLTGDDYICVGSRVTDVSDNTVLPSGLYRAREKKKLAVVRGRSGGK